MSMSLTLSSVATILREFSSFVSGRKKKSLRDLWYCFKKIQKLKRLFTEKVKLI